jgi:hypothetical protein
MGEIFSARSSSGTSVATPVVQVHGPVQLYRDFLLEDSDFKRQLVYRGRLGIVVVALNVIRGYRSQSIAAWDDVLDLGTIHDVARSTQIRLIGSGRIRSSN